MEQARCFVLPVLIKAFVLYNFQKINETDN